MSAKREDIMASAVKFLQDPKVQASSLGKKVAFLESKGLTSEEIEEAMSRANGTALAAPPAAGPVAGGAPGGQMVQYGYPGPQQGGVMVAGVPPPLPQKYDWKDMFIAAVVAGGFGYGMWQVAKKVVGPKLQWPSQEELEMDKQKLDEQFDEIEKSLAGVQDSTAAVAKSVEDQTAHVKESLENMTGVLDCMKTNDDKREQELAGLKTDIENIKSMIPKLMEKNKESQTNVLNELQTEIKSLKSLLLNRRAPGPGAPSTPTASPAAWNTASYTSSTSGSGSSSTTTTTTSAIKSEESNGALSFLNSKASIPAWQLAAQKTVESAPAPEGSSTDTTA
ncbi:peroxisomal membrane protein pex14 [Podila minutissima]|uniref:Peroxisomal membrane protein PEX14 n=1 Tax=Podila minutissima TaxID=64525 RepID=A0A9P5SJ94_9FUNG|nr:peroxisomal membrane protein pex14 [Podila minutissima]